VKYLTPEQELFIHARLIDETGGGHGVRDLGMLLSALVRPQATFDGNDLYPSLFSKAAALMESLTQNRPFVDGNKRTGITATAMFLQINGYKLKVSNPELEKFTFAVVLEHVPIEEIAVWFEQNTKGFDHLISGLKISKGEYSLVSDIRRWLSRQRSLADVPQQTYWLSRDSHLI